MRSNIIIVANRLPFSIQKGQGGLVCQPSPGGMAAALGPVRDHYNAQWIGWAGLDRPLSSAERKAFHIPTHAHDVAIPAADYDDYYHDVANGSLWPVLHGIEPRQIYKTHHWRSNLSVNKRFADRIVQIATSKDVIWIHDFHLIMLPELLKKAGLRNKIGFFLHIPVADVKMLSSLPHWPDMLRSLSTVDVCGVQTKRDVSNLQQSFAEHNIPAPYITNFPVGIDYSLFNSAHEQPAVQEHAARIAKNVASKRVILSISRLDYTKGILQQLHAIRAILAAGEHKNIVYTLIVAPSREALTEYSDLKKKIDQLVAEINLQYNGAILYEYRSMRFDEISAWYNHADVMLVTPFVDGMNLVAKEYIAARQKPGVLILGKGAGAAEQLKSALHVDPTDVASIVAGLNAALTMDDSEKKQRHATMRKNNMDEDVFWWAEKFVSNLRTF